MGCGRRIGIRKEVRFDLRWITAKLEMTRAATTCGKWACRENAGRTITQSAQLAHQADMLHAPWSCDYGSCIGTTRAVEMCMREENCTTEVYTTRRRMCIHAARMSVVSAMHVKA